MSKKAAKKAVEALQAPEEKQPAAPAGPLVMTRSEVEQLSDQDRDAFRHSGGTVIEDAAK